MKKSICYYFAITLLLISCQDKSDSIIDVMGSKLREHIENEAFKANKTVNIIEFAPIDYEEITENAVDSFAILQAMKRYLYFDDLANKQMKIVKNLSQQIHLAQSTFGKTDALTESVKEEYENEIIKLKRIQDSCYYYASRDSSIRQRILNRSHPRKVFHLKTYIKATFKDLNTDKSENISDTVYFFFDDNLELIKIGI